MKKTINVLFVAISLIMGISYASDDLLKSPGKVNSKPSSSARQPIWNLDIFAGEQRADSLGWNGANYNTDRGEIFGVGLSRRVLPRTYLGFEISQTKAKYTGNDAYISGISGILTARYNFFQTHHFSAYAGLGIGLVRPSFQQTGQRKYKETVTGSQATLGIRYKISPRTKLFLETRYMDTSEHFSVAGSGTTPSPAGATAEYNTRGFVLGFQYIF